MIRYRIRKLRSRRSRENIWWVLGSIVLSGPIVNQELALQRVYVQVAGILAACRACEAVSFGVHMKGVCKVSQDM
jgi:hypothetical protein